MARSHSRSQFPAMLCAALGLVLALPAAGTAQQKLLTIDDLYDPEKKIEFGGTPPTGLVWLDEKHYVWPKKDAKAKTAEWLKVEALTGRTEPLFDAAKMESALAKVPGMTAEEAKKMARRDSYTMNEKRTAVLLTVEGDLYLYAFGSDSAMRLTSAQGEEDQVSFSPDGTQAAFVRGNNLFVVDLGNATERQITRDGSDEVLNGKLDWVYQEEVYGRGNYRAYWWSPDSKQLAFLQLNEKGVPRYTLVNDIPYQPEVETGPYPKAGDPNPTVRLAVARAAGGDPVWVDTASYASQEFLIVDVAWTPDGKRVVYQVQDREQTWLDLNAADPEKGRSRKLLRETSKTWVENPGTPKWLKDGSFLWLSERSGWKHIYHYQGNGKLMRQVTKGKWEARTLHGVDEGRDWIYFSGTERSPVASDVYRVRLNGNGLKRLSAGEGTHAATFSPGFTHYLDTWSEVATPQQVRLHAADGTEARVIDENKVAALQEYRLGKPERLQVKTRDGFVMEALMIKPPDFDPRRKYPVYQHTYGGPHAPQVRNAWGGVGYMFHQMLAQMGIIVWICDNRSASGKGAESNWPAYKRLGELELRDIEDGLAWLKKQPYVDASRIGINGWSYGGFMVSYALTHSQSFAMGIAGGSVTDWRNYDSIYTERYMRTPQNNPEGYKQTAPTRAAANLHGKLLLMHGALDDNVHPQNTLQFAYELQKAGKPFRLMLYPKSRHGVTDPLLVKHLRTMSLAFIQETLLDGASR